MGRMKSLTNKSLWWFVGCTVVILLICTPLFYVLTKHYYAEEMVDVVESMQSGEDITPSDLEQDIMAGVMIQFGLIVVVLSVASVVTMRFVSKHLWTPFYDTMNKVEKFDLNKDEIPQFKSTDIQEFTTLNSALTELMCRNRNTFKSQKEFTQNASHELQTPLAVIQSKLDLLMQEDLGERQLNIVHDMYVAGNRMARLNRNLLLLAKMDNNQYHTDDDVDVSGLINENIATCENLYHRHNISCDMADHCLIRANCALTEIMINNLLVNALRNTPQDGRILINCSFQQFEIANTALGKALNTKHLFDRFNNSSDINRGNGIGLSIVKAVCNYHNWAIEYHYSDNLHHFVVRFNNNRDL